jgi:hypothetical protein
MFGAVNALFSGLAFAGLIYAILLQREELEFQRQELIETRAELKGQKEHLAAQSKTLQKQNFENTFFQLLRLHHDIVSAMEFDGNAGRECFESFLQNFAGHYRDLRTTSPGEMLNTAYLRFHEELQGRTGHYFRNLYNLVKFVKNSDVENKQFYANLVRAQLSSNELTLLFYNCLSSLGITKFKPLVEEFALLENMDQDKALPEHRSLYEEGAFRERP